MKRPGQDRPAQKAPRSSPAPGPELARDRSRALALTPVSRETAARLDRFVELLLAWQKNTQLVAASTVPQLWTRHVSDSLQLLDLAPTARVWIDLGSGAGFPGVALACVLADTENACVHLVESNGKKAAFLREAVRITGAPAVVHASRIEDFEKAFGGPADVVTARALAPLPVLLDKSFALLRNTGAVGIFPKGQDVEGELREATTYWDFERDLSPSRTDRNGRIVVVRALERRTPARE